MLCHLILPTFAIPLFIYIFFPLVLQQRPQNLLLPSSPQHNHASQPCTILLQTTITSTPLHLTTATNSTSLSTHHITVPSYPRPSPAIFSRNFQDHIQRKSRHLPSFPPSKPSSHYPYQPIYHKSNPNPPRNTRCIIVATLPSLQKSNLAP